MANPLYPSLIPRYVDESWFSSDQPVDEVQKITELELDAVMAPDTSYRNIEVQSHQQISTIEGVEDDDDGEMNDDDEAEVVEDDDEIDDTDYVPNDSPSNL